MTIHVGIIPDGSRRWSRDKGISLQEGYEVALRRLSELLVCGYKNHQIGEFSIYLLSRENLKRSTSDLEALYGALDTIVNEVWLFLVKEHKISVKHAGTLDQFPSYLRKSWEKLLSVSAKECDGMSSPLKLNVLLNYSPIDEVTQAVSRNSESVFENLWVNSPVDLVIRTGGVSLLSNFLPLQSGYAIIWTSDKLFNDFTILDLEDAIHHLKSIKHLYGS